MATDFNDIIYSSLNAEVASLVYGGSVTCEIHTWYRVPVGCITSWIAINCAHLPRPGLPYDQESPLFMAHSNTILVDDLGLNCRQGTVYAPRFSWPADTLAG